MTEQLASGAGAGAGDLIVQKLEDGSFGVISGGRRRAALNMLVDDKALGHSAASAR